MNEASQPSQQNTIIEEIKNRVLEVDALRHGTQHSEDIELPLDYIEALDEVTSIDREEIEDIARDVIAKHKNITRVQPQKRQRNKQRDINQWLINISLLLIISVTVKVVFLDDGSPKDPNEKSFATTIASTDFSALQQDATDTFSSIIDSAQALMPSAEDLPDLPFSMDDIDLATIEASASQTFSSIVQSAKDLLPQENIQTVSDDNVAKTADETIIAQQNIAEIDPITETAVSDTQENVTASNNTDVVPDATLDLDLDSDSDSDSTSTPSNETALVKSPTTVEQQPTQVLAVAKVTNKVIENAMTKGTTVEEELEKAALLNAVIAQANTSVNADITDTANIEDTLTNKEVITEVAKITTTENTTSEATADSADKDQTDTITAIKTTPNKADELLDLAPEIESPLVKDATVESVIAKPATAETNTPELTAKVSATKALANKDLATKLVITDETEIAKSDINIEASTAEAQDTETLEAGVIATMPVVMAETKLMKALDQAFTQLSNIKTPPKTLLAIEATTKPATTDAESLDITVANTSTVDKQAPIANEQKANADEQIAIVGEKITAESQKTATQVTNNTLPTENKLITKETVALIEQPKDIEAIEAQSATSIEPVKLVADTKSPQPTINVSSDRIQLVEESQTEPALASVNSNRAVSTLNVKPISTEPEVSQLALAELDQGSELNVESVDIDATTAIAQNMPSNNASQVLRATLGANDAIDDVTQKLIAAQQAPSTIKAITQQAVIQTAQPKVNNAEVAPLTAQSTPVVSEQVAPEKILPKQATLKPDEVVAQKTVSTATTAATVSTPATAIPTLNTDATVVATKLDSQSHYNGLNLKLQLNSIVDLTQLAKMSVSQFYSNKSRLPKPADKIDLPINDLKAHPLISDIYLSEQSDVIVKLAKYYGDDSQLTFTPSIGNNDGLINWKCNANIDPSLLVGPGESPCSLTQSASAPTSNTKL